MFIFKKKQKSKASIKNWVKKRKKKAECASRKRGYKCNGS